MGLLNGITPGCRRRPALLPVPASLPAYLQQLRPCSPTASSSGDGTLSLYETGEVLGELRHQWSACLLPADSPGRPHGSLRDHRVCRTRPGRYICDADMHERTSSRRPSALALGKHHSEACAGGHALKAIVPASRAHRQCVRRRRLRVWLLTSRSFRSWASADALYEAAHEKFRNQDSLCVSALSR